jgi:hypothetical protein
MVLTTARTKDRCLRPRQAFVTGSIDFNAGRNFVPGGRAHEDQGAHDRLLNMDTPLQHAQLKSYQMPTTILNQDTSRAPQ